MRFSSTLPATFGVVAAGQQAFSVYNDLLAYPQYSVVFSESFIAASDAKERLQAKEHSFAPSSNTELSTGQDGSTTSHPGGQDTYERMIFNSKPYLCTIPYVAPYIAPANSTMEQSHEEHQSELERATSSGLELLKGMPECIYYNAGWWAYSFCYGQGVKQFHRLPPGGNVPAYPPREDPNVFPFILGRFSDPVDKAQNNYVEGEANAQEQQPLTESGDQDRTSAAKQVSLELKTRGDANYLVQKLDGGTICDLTGKPRTITVQFHCNEGMIDHIHMIKEMATCVYLMEIHTPRLCEDVAFLPPQYDRPNVIACQEIVERSKEKEWRSAFTARAKETLTGKVKSKSELLAIPIVVGGVELGGKKLVGADAAHAISPSNILKPAKQLSANGKYLATIARSDGTYRSVMNKAQMKKLGVEADIDKIDSVIERTEKWAGEGEPWRLELVEIGNDLEFRAVRGDQEEEAETKAGGDASKDKQGSKEEYKGS